MVAVILWGLAAWGIAVAVHEGGHAVAALLVGAPVRSVTIGGGPAICRARIGATALVLRAIPVTGATLVDLSGQAGRAMAVVVLGGVLANGICVLGLLALAAALRLPVRGPYLILIVLQLWSLKNLLPYRLTVNGQAFESDGLHALRLLLIPASPAPDSQAAGYRPPPE